MIEFANALIPKHNIAIVVSQHEVHENPAFVHSSECIRYRIDIYLMKPYDGVNKVSKIYATEELMLNEYKRIKAELL
jgi:hypothetical protein